ncbi:monooxygenase [Plectosphaerella plurivora]|uniref:Monooxygenase n=1 Tax=Plectosphaerella plurivora TaxID=936078 RepID=A0A9P8V5S4_9PEZI|nr:monooxygenase [Plectosphaerella plurivora]
MHFKSLATHLAIFASATAIPLAERDGCTPAVRQEWRKLPRETQQSYIEAVKCLKTKPSRLGKNLTTSLYDDFPYAHAHLALPVIHFVASFLPWHRYFVHVYEKALQDCGYKGVATYWDWTLDVANVSTSSIWDAETGFGGNGAGSDNCIADGPFKDFPMEYIQTESNKHCLRRTFNDATEEVGDVMARYYTPAIVETISHSASYNDYHIALESGPHGAVHSGIGGDMSPASSPNDPIFFLHHGQIDRLWTLWQAANPANRTMEYSGIRTQDQFDGVTPPAATLEDIMPMFGLADDVAVKEYMNTQAGPLCYRYE